MSATTNDWVANTITARQAVMHKSRRPVDESRLHPARGILTAFALAVPFWVIVGVALYELI
jgi:hypothetical protein